MKTSIKKWFANWRDFEGTTTRKEYWVGLTFSIIFFTVVFLIVLASLAGDIQKSFNINQNTMMVSYLAITILYLIYFLIQLLSATIRRLNDAGKNRWWSVLIAVAVVLNFMTALLGQAVIYPMLISIITLAILCLLPSKTKK